MKTRTSTAAALAVALLSGCAFHSTPVEEPAGLGPAAEGFTLIQTEADTVPAPSEVNSLPVEFDVAVVRPARFFSMVNGVLIFAVISPGVSLTRPQEFRAVWDTLVVEDAKALWLTPLGQDAAGGSQ